jgi:DHA1 family multidrug resistance protein-like MFS transporter
MKDIIRDSTIGQLTRWISRNTVLQYVEETPGFQCTHCYASSSKDDKSIRVRPSDPEKAISGPVSGPVSSASSGVETPVDRTDDTLGRSETQYEDIKGSYKPIRMWKIPTQAELHNMYSQAAAAE